MFFNADKWIEGMRGDKALDLTLSDLAEVQKMLVDGDLLHIDGPRIRALDDLATEGKAEYLGCEIIGEGGRFTVHADCGSCVEEGALSAIIACETFNRARATKGVRNAV